MIIWRIQYTWFMWRSTTCSLANLFYAWIDSGREIQKAKADKEYLLNPSGAVQASNVIAKWYF